MLLTIGTIIVINKDFTKDSEKYKSKVIDLGEGYVMIDYPTHIETGKSAFFMDGTQLLATFSDESQTSYAFKTEVGGRQIKGVPMLKLSYPGDSNLVKVQRREFVRVDTDIDVAVIKDGNKAQLIAEDISAGGLALRLPSPILYNEKDIISLVVVLPFMNNETKYVQTDGEIIRIFENAGKMIASVQFDGINEEDRQRVIRFCFERQLQKRNE